MATTPIPTTSPADPTFFAGHDSDALRTIVDRYTASSLAMLATGAEALAQEALTIANNAWYELAIRGEVAA